MEKLGSLLGIFFLAMASGTDSCGAPAPQPPLLNVQLTDSSQPLQRGKTTQAISQESSYDHVYVTFDEVSVLAGPDEIDGDWQVVSAEVQTVDLMSLGGGALAQIGLAELEEGMYSQIRLHLTGSSVVVEGQEYPMTVPSGGSSGLKIQGEFSLEPDMETVVTLDFDAESSVRYNQGRGYSLQPVVKLLSVEYLPQPPLEESPTPEPTPPIDDEESGTATPSPAPEESPTDAPSPTPEVTPTGAPSPTPEG